MKRLDRILLFIISLIGIGLSFYIFSFFYPIPFVIEAIKALGISDIWLNYIFAGYSTFTGLVFLFLLLFSLFSPSRYNSLFVEKNKGKLIFSKKTVESVAYYSFKDLDGIAFSEVRVKFNKNPEKTKIYVKLSINNTDELINLTQAIQNRIESAVQTSLNINVKLITIKVVGLSSGETVKDSRVV